VKLLTPHELIETLPADDATVRSALALFDEILPCDLRDPGVCLAAYKDGHVQATTVNVDGSPAHLLLHHLTYDRGLYIDVAKGLREGGRAADIFAGVDQIASARGAKYILFATVRRGLVRLAQEHGYSPCSINLLKGAPCATKER